MTRTHKFTKWSPRIKNAMAALLFFVAYSLSAVSPFVSTASAAVVSSSVSSTGFVMSGSYSSVAGQPTGTGQFKNGNVGAYPEGACIPALFQVTNTSGTTGDLFVTPVYDYAQVGSSQRGFTDLEVTTTTLANAKTATNLNQMNYPGTSLSAATSFQTTTGTSVTATVSGAYSGNNTSTTAVSSSDSFRHYNVTLLNVPAGVTVNVLLCGRLGLDASEYTGSSLSLRTVQGGQENVPVPVNQILALPSLTLQKTVASGTALPSDFSFTVSPAVNGQSTYSIPVGASSLTIPNVNPNGQFTVTETGPAGYLFTSGTGTSCVVSTSTLNTAGGQMVATVAAGKPASNATCTFVNSVQKGSITIVKDAVPNGPQDFAFTTTGTGLSGFSLDDDSDAALASTKTFTNLLPGSYSVTEQATTGWDLSNVSCTGGGTQVSGATATITLAPGANVSCTYTNRQRGNIVVNKVTNPVNDPTAFSITASGSGAIAGTATRSLTTAQSVTYNVAQGTYAVTETVPAGWTQTGNTCAYLTINGSTPKVNGVPTLTCTITNTKLAKLKIVKDALPNDAQDFAFTTTGTGLSGFSLDDDSDATLSNEKVFTGLMPGAYAVTETSTPGWAMTGLTCDTNNYTVSGSQVSVQLTAGQETTCTYTNTKLGSLSGTKFEVNADGSQLGGSSDWVIHLFNNGVDTGLTGTTAADGTYSFGNLLPGNYSVTETLKAGWTQIYSPLSPVALAAGQTVTDQNFGNFQNGSISGYKFNDHNGNGQQDRGDERLSGWTITLYKTTANGNVQVGDAVQTNADGNYQFTNLAPGTYWVCETQQTGWVQTYPANNACQQVVIDQSGETNEAVKFGNQGRGTITVKKNVDSNGDGTVDYYNVDNWQWDYGTDADFATGTTQTVAAGTYSVSEHQWENYHLTSVSCSGERSVEQNETIEISVAPGEAVVCTYTNTRDTGFIKVVKEIYPSDDDGVFNLLVDGTVKAENVGDAGTTEWVRVPTGTRTVSETAGTDTDMAHYDSWYMCWDDSEEFEGMRTAQFDGYWNEGEGTTTDVAVEMGQRIVCSFYNERHAMLTVQKNAQPNGPQDFTFTLTPVNKERHAAADRSPLAKDPIDLLALSTMEDDGSDTPVGNSFVLDDDTDATLSNTKDTELSSGWYRVVETATPGWDLTDIDCGDNDYWSVDDSGVLEVWLEVGANMHCTFTNTQRATVTITKDTQPNFGQPFSFTTDLTDGQDNTTFSLTDDGVNAALASRTFSGVVPGEYVVSEAALAGWTLSDITCTGAKMMRDGTKLVLEVSPGATVHCTFVNKKNTVPQVLGDTTVTPRKLADTGSGLLLVIAMSITVMGLAFFTAFGSTRRPQNTTL